VFFREGEISAGHAAAQGIFEQAQELQGLACLPVTRYESFLNRYEALIDCFQIGKQQLSVDDLDIPCRIYQAIDMDHIGVIETADNMYDSIHLPDMTEKLVAQSLSSAGPFYQAGNIQEFHGCICLFRRVDDFSDKIESGIGNGHHPDVRVDGTEGVIGHLCPRCSQGIENC